MADSSGTWLKLPAEKWQFIPREIQEQANKLDLTWEGATKWMKFCRLMMDPAKKLLLS